MLESMPYKFNEPRSHKIPTAKYRVTNWPDYDAALVRRGALAVWFTDEAITAGRAPATGRRGGQPIYSALAIETPSNTDRADTSDARCPMASVEETAERLVMLLRLVYGNWIVTSDLEADHGT